MSEGDSLPDGDSGTDDEGNKGDEPGPAK
jgi:hypothetical protein